MIFRLIPLCLAAAAVAQEPYAPAMREVGPANLPSQKIGPHDLLAISVYRSPELSRTVRVDLDGTIALPLLEAPVAAAGLMPAELESAIAAGLKSSGILVNPIVKVTVAEYNSRPVRVAGAVRKPVTFQAMGRVTLLDAINRAEGIAPDAGPEILITRPGLGDPLLIPVRDLIARHDSEFNILLEGGEEIRVPEAGRLFVIGNVHKPGSFPVRDAADATVLRMVALAGGLAPFHSRQAFIRRNDPAAAQPVEIAVELERILERKSPDVALQPGDILYVPDNKSRRTAMNVIDRITNFGAATASGVLIWRR